MTLTRLWDRFIDSLWNLADKYLPEPPDYPRWVINCKCHFCGLTQLVSAYSEWRNCANCKFGVSTTLDAIGERELIR